jgi:hypothetical protein
MKKYLLSLLTVLVVLSSCQKEDDLLTPVPQPPQTNSNTTNINTDTTTNINGDTTTNNNGTGNVLQAFDEDYVVATNNNNVTVVQPSAAFPGWGKNYDVTKSEFSMTSVDTSYSYTSTNYQSQWGNGHAYFYQVGPNYGGGELYTTVYPQNGSSYPTHSVSYSEKMMGMTITQYSYAPYSGILGLDVEYLSCSGVLIQWHVDMVVTEYSDGTLELSIDNTGYCNGGVGSNFGTGPWNSQLKITLVEQI